MLTLLYIVIKIAVPMLVAIAITLVAQEIYINYLHPMNRKETNTNELDY